MTAGRAWVFRLRAALLILVIVAGVVAFAPRAFAQTTPSPGARWTPGGVWTHDVTTTSLIGKLMLQQSVTITGGSRQWANAAIDACPWTRVTLPLPSTACRLLKDYNANGFPNHQDLRLTNFIPTQAMIDNGGVVIRLRWRNYNSPAGNNVGMVEWVPLLPPPSATLVLTPPSISENGGVATVSATLDRQWSDAVTITVSASAVGPGGAGRLHAERDDADLRGERHDEHRDGDAHRGGQRDRCAAQVGDRFGNRLRQRDQRAARRNADHHRRRRRPRRRR